MDSSALTVKDLFGEEVRTHTSNVIANEFDNGIALLPKKNMLDELKSLSPGGGPDISTEDLLSDDIEVAERAIANLHSGIQSYTLVLSIAVFSLVQKTGFSSKYAETAPGRLRMNRFDFSLYCLIGRTWNKYHERLIKIGFRPNRDVSKLRYIDRAAAIYGEDEAINRFMSMGIQDYIEWARGERALPPSVEVTHRDVKIELTPKGISANDRIVVSIKDVRRIVSGGGLPYVVSLDNEGEARVVDRALKEHRSKR